MELVKKIDHKVFWPFSLISTLIFCLLAKSKIEIYTILCIYIAVLFSLYTLMAILFSVLSDPVTRATGKIKKGKITLYLFFHISFLFGSIGMGVLFMGNRIIIPIFNYVLQIFILGFALRKNLK